MRTTVKRGLARAAGRRPAQGATVLIYHRVGGGIAGRARPGVARVRAPSSTSSATMGRLPGRGAGPARRRTTAPHRRADVRRRLRRRPRPRLAAAHGTRAAVHALPRHGFVGGDHALGRVDRQGARRPRRSTWDQLREMARQRAVHRRQPHAHPRPARAARPPPSWTPATRRSRSDSASGPGTSPTPGVFRSPPWKPPCGRASAAPSPASSGATYRAPTRCGCAASLSGAPTRSTFFRAKLPRPARAGARVRRAIVPPRRRRAPVPERTVSAPRRRRRPAAAGRAPHHGGHEPLAAPRAPSSGSTSRRGSTTYGVSAPGPYVERSRRSASTPRARCPSLTRSWHPRARPAAARELLRGPARDPSRRAAHPQPEDRRARPGAGRAARGSRSSSTPATGSGRGPTTGSPSGARCSAPRRSPRRFSHAELYQNADDRAHPRAGPCRGTGPGSSATASTSTRFRPRPGGPAPGYARELGVADDELLVGGVGRRVAEKGIREYAEAAARARRQGAASCGSARPTRQARRAGASAETGVEFLGEPRATCPPSTPRSTSSSCPSYREGFSRSAMEAAACGLPMVLSDIRGCREIGTHDEHLLLVPPRDAGPWPTAVERLLDRRRAPAPARRGGERAGPDRVRPARGRGRARWRRTPQVARGAAGSAGAVEGASVRRIVDVIVCRTGRSCCSRRSCWSRGCWSARSSGARCCSGSGVPAWHGREFSIVKFRTMRPEAVRRRAGRRARHARLGRGAPRDQPRRAAAAVERRCAAT